MGNDLPHVRFLNCCNQKGDDDDEEKEDDYDGPRDTYINCTCCYSRALNIANEEEKGGGEGESVLQCKKRRRVWWSETVSHKGRENTKS